MSNCISRRGDLTIGRRWTMTTPVFPVLSSFSTRNDRRFFLLELFFVVVAYTLSLLRSLARSFVRSLVTDVYIQNKYRRMSTRKRTTRIMMRFFCLSCMYVDMNVSSLLMFSRITDRCLFFSFSIILPIWMNMHQHSYKKTIDAFTQENRQKEKKIMTVTVYGSVLSCLNEPWSSAHIR